MCIRTVYYNTYADGSADITERVDTCTPGYICPHPRVMEFNRDFNVSRDRARAARMRPDRSPARSLSPGGSGYSGHSGHSRSGSASSAASAGTNTGTGTTYHRAGRTDIYVNGTRMAPRPPPSPPSHATSSPIPIRRSATTAAAAGPLPELRRGRRASLVDDRMPFRHTAFPASPPPRIHYHPPPDTTAALDDDDLTGGSRARLRRRLSPPPPLPLFEEHRTRTPLGRSPTTTYYGGATRSPLSPRSPRSPLSSPLSSPPPPPRRSSTFLRPPAPSSTAAGYGSAEDEEERAQRRRRRRAQRLQAAEVASSLPAMGGTDVFGSSAESSTATGPAARPRIVTPSPAATAAKKELRWEDEMRRRQNARIHQRPKLSREEAAAAAAAAKEDEATPLQGEVRSILKTATAEPRSTSRPPSTSRPSSRPSSRPPSRSASRATPRRTDDVFASLAGLSGLSLDGEASTTAASSSAAAAAAAADDAAERDRLSSRFRMPPRRFTAGGPFRQRTEMYFPGDDLFRF